MEHSEPREPRQVALLIRDVPSARSGVVSVRVDQTLAEAQTLMSAHQYSQLAVISGSGHLEGAVSWRSIAQARLARDDVSLKEAKARSRPVALDDDLLRQIDVIYDDDFVFVTDGEDKLCGIVTTADLTYLLRDRTTQFFQIGDSERRLRRCIDRAFSREELRAATGQKKLESAGDLTFGQYEGLLQDSARWQKMGWEGVDQVSFIAYLDGARIIRNKVMHFGEELAPREKQQLEQFFNLMRALDPEP
jgi:CBS domain-containing protein